MITRPRSDDHDMMVVKVSRMMAREARTKVIMIIINMVAIKTMNTVVIKTIDMVVMKLLSWGWVDIFSRHDPWIGEYAFIHQKSSSIYEIKLNMTE